MFKFYEDEAVRLSSFYRYIGMIIVVPFFLLCSQMLLRHYPHGISRRAAAMALGIYLAFAPWGSLLDAASGFYSQSSQAEQADFLAMEQKVRDAAVTGKERIYVIAEDSGGYESLVLRYRLHDFDVCQTGSNIIAQGEKERFNTVISAEKWQEQLVTGSYDLVIVYQTTEAFAHDYASVFEQPDLIGQQQLYRLNPETQKLVLVD